MKRYVNVLGSVLTGVMMLGLAPGVVADDSNIHRPVFAPDGETIIFMASSEETGGDWELFSMRADGRDRSRLTDHAGWDGYAVWSPDGTRIIFDRSRSGDGDNKAPFHFSLESKDGGYLGDYDGWLSVNDWRENEILAFWERDAQRDLYLLNEDGDIIRNLTNTPDISEHDAHFSPDGTSIAFASGPAAGEGATMLESIDLQTGERSVQHQSIGRIYGLDWSPDGRKIAFTDAPGGDEDDADVFFITLASGEVEAVTRDESWDHMPEWAPSGEAIIFTSYRSGAEKLYIAVGDGDIIRLWAGGEE